MTRSPSATVAAFALALVAALTPLSAHAGPIGRYLANRQVTKLEGQLDALHQRSALVAGARLPVEMESGRPDAVSVHELSQIARTTSQLTKSLWMLNAKGDTAPEVYSRLSTLKVQDLRVDVKLVDGMFDRPIMSAATLAKGTAWRDIGMEYSALHRLAASNGTRMQELNVRLVQDRRLSLPPAEENTLPGVNVSVISAK